jgi:hypothetical protein
MHRHLVRVVQQRIVQQHPPGQSLVGAALEVKVDEATVADAQHGVGEPRDGGQVGRQDLDGCVGGDVQGVQPVARVGRDQGLERRVERQGHAGMV